MTLISAISNIGSVNNTKKHSLISNEKINSSISLSGTNQSASLLDTKIMACLLGILGVGIKAKVF